jgi:ABC-type dipeptide/oligopeptide/nickel transport system permease subunit
MNKSKKDLLRRMRKSKFFMIGQFGILIIVSFCFLSPLFIQFDPLQSNLRMRLAVPEFFSNGIKGHIFGCDALGRDILSRLLIGGRTSVMISLSIVLITTFFGLTLGLISGYYGGVIEMVLMRICDTIMSIPSLLLAICVIAVLGASVPNLIFTLSITGWIMMARVVRSTALSIRNAEYVKAARVLGMPDYRIIFKEVLINVLSPVITTATQAFGSMLLTEASMSFLGLGVPLPAPSWGGMISDGREYISTAPWVVIVPGVLLMLTVLSFNFLGDGMTDIFNPRNVD